MRTRHYHTLPNQIPSIQKTSFHFTPRLTLYRHRHVLLQPWKSKERVRICRRCSGDSGREAVPYWSSDDKVQVRMQLRGVFLLTLATTGISVSFNFLGRDFHNALANKDQEQFMKQLLYYLGAFAGGIPIFVLRNYARETLSLRWRSWMERYYIDHYLSNQTFYRIQSQSIIDNPDQQIVDDLSSFTGTALSFSLTLFNAVIDLISFSNILFGIYPPLFVVLYWMGFGDIKLPAREKGSRFSLWTCARSRKC